MSYIMLLHRESRYTVSMKIVKIVLPILVVLLAVSPGYPSCNVCHSKRPEMRKMHEALEYKNCFDCHGPTASPTDRASRTTDLRCLPCHKS